jgi:hypothetical protein
VRNLRRQAVSCHTTFMAHFPQPHNRLRAARIRVPHNESVKVNLGGSQVSAILHKLSMTGGLVQFDRQIGEVALAEVVFATASGPVNALVEFLSPDPKEAAASQPFRFVALDDEDYHRLASTLQFMRKQGWEE